MKWKVKHKYKHTGSAIYTGHMNAAGGISGRFIATGLSEKDARLIVLTPDLMRMLKACVHELENNYYWFLEPGSVVEKETASLIKRAKRVIAKR